MTENIEPFGYYCEHVAADPCFLRPPSYIPPTGGNYTTTPLYTASQLQVALYRAERAEWRVEDLESEAERVSTEFEVDCWVAMRSLLNECNYDWGCTEPDGVTAEDAREHISTTIDEMDKSVARWRDRATTAEAALAEARKVIEPLKARADKWANNTDSARVSVRLGDLRALSQWLSAHPAKETKG